MCTRPKNRYHVVRVFGLKRMRQSKLLRDYIQEKKMLEALQLLKDALGLVCIAIAVFFLASLFIRGGKK